MFKSVCLEMSLKPFKKTDEESIRLVCEQIFDDWRQLTEEAEVISIMFWTADGSEILDYRGDLDGQLEWAYYIGSANKSCTFGEYNVCDGKSLHMTRYLYTDEIPVITYRVLKTIVRIMKEVGRERYPDKQIRLGATFDPGPEFAESDFKYNRHPEICLGTDMGKAIMVCAYAKLRGDNVAYAGFPDGIPDGLPFGTFFGRQSQHFLSDLDFDFLWFSNGLGFGRETWSTDGDIFDGTKFDGERLPEIQREVYEFWTLFRKECPNFQIQTRGTNMSTGIDFASDGVPLAKIYQGGFNMLPPPNSPWAALNGDFGLELMGYMSRICEVPENEYLYRFYLHDPWWQNTPWYDRYYKNPHDIYLPLACARIDREGKVQPPTHMNILTIDNSCGEMPKNCVTEVIPHLLQAQKDMPDAVSPVVWVYPFSEYSNPQNSEALAEMFFGDWFIRDAINYGLPMSSVVSTDNFVRNNTGIYDSSVLVSIVPKAGTEYERKVIEYAEAGGKVIFYGTVKYASKAFLDFFKILRGEELEGEMELEMQDMSAIILRGEELEGEMELEMQDMSAIILHDGLLSAGGVDTEAGIGAEVLATAGKKAYMVRSKNSIWVRGTSSNYYRKGNTLLIPHEPEKYFAGEKCMLSALELLGYSVRFERFDETCKNPVIMLHRSNNAFYFSTYSENTTVKTKLKLPWGAPVLDGYEALIRDGYAEYQFPKSAHTECRVFVEQQDGVVSCRERSPVSCDIRRRIGVNNLKNATLRIFPESYAIGDVIVNEVWGEIGEEARPAIRRLEGKWIKGSEGGYYEVHNATGNVLISMPSKRKYKEIEFKD